MDKFATTSGTKTPRTRTILRNAAGLAQRASPAGLMLGLLLGGGLGASAGTVPVRIAMPVAAVRVVVVAPIRLGATTQPANSAEIQTLQQAYAILAVADHDYKGHRVKAMKHIADASEVMGAPLSGDGKDKEKQTLSDAQLNQVIGMLQQVRTTAAGNNQKKVVKHLDEAIKHLNIALSIR